MIFGTGGGGIYEPGYELPWRFWNEFVFEARPGAVYWPVGKLDGRRFGPIGTFSATHEALDAIFDYEAPHILEFIKARKGQIFEVANEPNWYPMFDPVVYRKFFLRYEKLIKTADPTAKMMIGGITTPVPWLEWLNESCVEPDIWSIHPYSIPLVTSSVSIEAIKRFRNARPNKPIWITEFSSGGWSPIAHSPVITYIYEMCWWLKTNCDQYKIDAALWWGVADKTAMGDNGLFTGGPYGKKTITDVGRAYYDAIGKKVYKTFVPVVVR